MEGGAAQAAPLFEARFCPGNRLCGDCVTLLTTRHADKWRTHFSHGVTDTISPYLSIHSVLMRSRDFHKRSMTPAGKSSNVFIVSSAIARSHASLIMNSSLNFCVFSHSRNTPAENFADGSGVRVSPLCSDLIGLCGFSLIGVSGISRTVFAFRFP